MLFTHSSSPTAVRRGRGASLAAMRPASLAVVFVAALVARDARAANHVFDIQYFGNGVTALAAGSEEPIGVALNPGDTFQWTIAAQNGGFWRVDAAGDFFPLMAFQVAPSSERTADFALSLRNDGAEVFAYAETGAVNSFVHAGTNVVTLPPGLAFDEMYLDYLLVGSSTPDPTIINSRLPIFGAPESNPFSPGIAYVPEPSSMGLAALAACALAVVATRRAQRVHNIARI